MAYDLFSLSAMSTEREHPGLERRLLRMIAAIPSLA
jgi:hypothetical protein